MRLVHVLDRLGVGESLYFIGFAHTLLQCMDLFTMRYKSFIITSGIPKCTFINSLI